MAEQFREPKACLKLTEEFEGLGPRTSRWMGENELVRTSYGNLRHEAWEVSLEEHH